MSYLGLKNKIALTIDNKIVTDYEFDYAKETKDTIALWNDKILAWYDKKTCKCINQVADFSSLEFSNGIFVLGFGEYKVAYNLSGKLLIGEKYTDIIPEDKYIEVKDGKKCGAYNYDGKLILPVKYETIYDYEAGLVVKESNRCLSGGLYSYDGTGSIIPEGHCCTFLNHNGMVIYETATKNVYAIISREGKELGKFKTEGGRFWFLDNAIKIQINDKKGLVSLYGKEIAPPEYDWITEIAETNNTCYILDKGDRAGIATLDKGITIPVEFDEKVETYKDYVILRKGHKYALYNYDGEELIPLGDKKITSEFFETPGVFEISDPNDESKLMYIAPLNKYIPYCSVNLDKQNGIYYFKDDILDEWGKV